MTCGFLYVATGKKYLDEAVKSAVSLRKQMPDANITIVTDQDCKTEIFNHSLAFQGKSDASNPKTGYIAKAYAMLQSLYDKTIFIDTDIYFTDDCTELFELLDYFDLAITHDYMETSYAVVKERQLHGYRTYNTGVIVFRKNERVNRFIQDWADTFIAKIEKYWSDQPAFMEVLLRHDIKSYSLQTNYNFRFNQFLTVPNGKVKMLHGRHPDIEGIATIVNASEKHRSWDPKAWRCHGWGESVSFFDKLKGLL